MTPKELLILRAGGKSFLGAEVVRNDFTSMEASGLLAMIGPEVSEKSVAVILYSWILDHKVKYTKLALDGGGTEAVFGGG